MKFHVYYTTTELWRCEVEAEDEAGAREAFELDEFTDLVELPVPIGDETTLLLVQVEPVGA